MSKFRKKPVVIEARPFDAAVVEQRKANTVGRTALEQWCGGTIQDHSGFDAGVILIIPTLEGNMTACVGDWIIRGVQGEFYSCRPDIFAATYEEANGASRRDWFAEITGMRVRLQRLIDNPAFADTREVLQIRAETLDTLLDGATADPGERHP